MSSTVYEFSPREKDWDAKTTIATDQESIYVTDFLTRENHRADDKEHTYWGTAILWPDDHDGSMGSVIIKGAGKNDQPYVYAINELGDDFRASFKRKLADGRVVVQPGRELTEFVSYAAVTGDLTLEQQVVRSVITAYNRDRTLGQRALRALRGIVNR